MSAGVRLGIIGAGAVAQAHANAIQSTAAATLAAVFDTDPERARALAVHHGSCHAPTLEALLDRVDAVIVTTPNDAHVLPASTALLYGRPVLCEKPLACTVAEAEALSRQARTCHVPHAVGFNYRWLPAVRTLRRLVDAGELGEIVAYRLSFLKGSSLRKKHITWRDQAASRRSSGALGDLGSHLIDLVHLLSHQSFRLDSIRAALRTGVGHRHHDPVMVDDHAYVCATLEDGAFVELHTSKTERTERGLTLAVTGTKAEFIHRSTAPETYGIRSGVSWEAFPLDALPEAQDPPREVYGWTDSFRHQLTAFLHPSERACATFDDGLAVQRVLEHALGPEPADLVPRRDDPECTHVYV